MFYSIIMIYYKTQLCKQNFAGSLTFPSKSQNYRWVLTFLVTESVNNLQKKAENPRSSEEVDWKISWSCGCCERFCRKESGKVSLKTCPKTWSFTCTVWESQSISVLLIWFDLSGVIWLLFKTQMKDDLMQ